MANILEDELSKIEKLPDDWAPGSRPIQQKAVELTRKVLPYLQQDIEHWGVAPFINGSIFLCFRDEKKSACINVATLGISGFVETSDTYDAITLKTDQPDCISRLVEFIQKK